MQDGGSSDRSDIVRDIPDSIQRDGGTEPKQPELLATHIEPDSVITDRRSDRRSDKAQHRIAEIYKLFKDTERSTFETYIQQCYQASQKSTGRYLSDVIQCRDDKHAYKYAEELRSHVRDFGRGIIIVSVHGSHVHVIHDCSFADGSCRCKWRKETKGNPSVDIRRPLHRRKRGIELRRLTKTDWEDILLYFSTHQRHTTSSNFFRQVEGLQSVCESLQSIRLSQCKRQGKIGSCGEEDPAKLQQELCFPDELDCEDGGGSSKVLKRNKRARSELNYDCFSETLQFLDQNPICPIENIVDHPKYLNHPFLCRFRLDNHKVCNAIEVFGKRLMSWTIDDYFKYYSRDDVKPIFSAGVGDINDYYYDLEDSVNMLVDLVMHQCNYDDIIACNFVTDLYNVLERKIPKYNCLVIHSVPNCGKNFLIDCVADYFINKGILGRANKHNGFAFQNASGRRIIIWDEPNYEPAVKEDLKKMFAGTAYTVRVKSKGDSACFRTPVIVMTNNTVPFMHDDAFNTRIKIWHWKAAPQLKKFSKFPLPLATYYLFLRFGLINETNYIYFYPLFR